jgi:protein ImuB
MLHAWLPTWQTDLAARRHRRTAASPAEACPPILLTESIAERRIVHAACRSCRQAGIQAGLTLAEARQRLDADSLNALQVEPAQPKRDAAALHALAQWARRYTPITAADPPDGLHLDVTGCSHLFGGESALAHRIHAELSHLTITSRIAMAPTATAARGLARFSSSPHPIVLAVDPTTLATHIAPLPIAALGIDAAMVDQLHDVGIETIAHLMDLPRDDLVARAGHNLLHRLDAALNRRADPITPPPVSPCTITQQQRTFNGPVRDIATIGLAITECLQKLCHDLERRHQGVETLVLRLERPRQEDLVHTLRLTAPSRTPKHLLAVLAPIMERLDPGPDGTECLRVIAQQEAPLMLRQDTIIETGHTPAQRSTDDEAISQLIDMLRQRCGTDSVIRRLLVDAHLPERCGRDVPWETPALPPAPPPSLQPPTTDRPTRLLPRAEPATITLPTSTRPGQLYWRGHTAPLIDACGPERLTETWWTDDHAAARDYWRLQRADGQWLWVYRNTTTDRWFVHGAWT